MGRSALRCLDAANSSTLCSWDTVEQIRPGAFQLHAEEAALLVHYEVRVSFTPLMTATGSMTLMHGSTAASSELLCHSRLLAERLQLLNWAMERPDKITLTQYLFLLHLTCSSAFVTWHVCALPDT